LLLERIENCSTLDHTRCRRQVVPVMERPSWILQP
jgi:hypothetical protein